MIWEYMGMRMHIVVGDVHGCLAELQALVRKVGYRGPEHDSLILAGDLLDRGPQPVETVEYCMQIGALPVMGNHEEKALRWLGHEARAAREPTFHNPMNAPISATAAVNPHVSGTRELNAEAVALRERRIQARLARGEGPVAVQPARKTTVVRPIPEARKAEWKALSSAQVAWLRAAPLWRDLGNGWLVVHAGFEGRSLEVQTADKVIRVRYVDPKTGTMVPYSDDSLDQPKGSVAWQDVWGGPQNVLYGHAVHSRKVPRFDTRGDVRMIGIDTGCCFGGRLTAAVFKTLDATPDFVQVDAEREYLPFPGVVPDER
jgi:bis(5'-nucleosyl)-tetraphosphatase (symmetrical)